MMFLDVALLTSHRPHRNHPPALWRGAAAVHRVQAGDAGGCGGGAPFRLPPWVSVWRGVDRCG